jgi:hypothetical protein
MDTAERIFELAQAVAGSYNIFQARREGSGDPYTREVVDRLKFLVAQQFGPGVVDQLLNPSGRQSVDFWLADEHAIVEVKFSALNSGPGLETEIFKALLAKDAGHDVQNLILIGEPGSVGRYQAPAPRSIIEWVERHHHLRVQVWELMEKGKR